MIRQIRILPPFAIGRVGSGDRPLDNFRLEDDPDHPLGPRRLAPADTLVVNDDGSIERVCVPGQPVPPGPEAESTPEEPLTFKTDGRIRPAAPFLEVHVPCGEEEDAHGTGTRPLTLDDLSALGIGPERVSWRVRVANRKIRRRTDDPNDTIAADTGWFSHHDEVELQGRCANFAGEGDFVSFGHVRAIRPTQEFPRVRLRFTPPAGLIYGPRRPESDADPVVPPERAIYDGEKGGWVRFGDYDAPGTRLAGSHLGYINQTLPPSLYAIEPPAPTWLNDNIAIGRGYFDDTSDGFVDVRLELPDGTFLQASARICAGPPHIVPDAVFLRTLADDLEQVVHGPMLDEAETAAEALPRARDTVRRAFETLRFMNLAVANGNDFKGRSALLLDSMPQEEAADTERALHPVMAPESVDTLTIASLHEQVYATLQAGAAPWFRDILRRPEEVADFTDHGRRKMPALMCGADNGYLALTRRQIATIERAFAGRRAERGVAPSAPGAAPAVGPAVLTARNRTAAALAYVAEGNPPSTRPESSVANCCPGLELDFRAVWRRVFRGVELREYDNLVIRSEPGEWKGAEDEDLKGHRLLRVVLDDGREIGFTCPIIGPAVSDVDGAIRLTTDLNPEGLAPLEWSNALAPILAEYQGRSVRCDFTETPSEAHASLSEEPRNYRSLVLEVRHFFQDDTAVIAEALAEPGELTQGLCSPWQNDYRECSCYYWASARPDFVNVEFSPSGLSQGDNWLQKRRTGSYVPDDYVDSRLMLYEDLFTNWETLLRFQIGGRDAPGEEKEVK